MGAVLGGGNGSGVEEIEGFLREVVEEMELEGAGYRGPGRPAVLPSLCLWSGMLVCVLHGFSSQLEVWRLLAVEGLWNYPLYAVGDQAVYHRLARGGAAPMERLFAAVTEMLRDRLAPYGERGLAAFAPAVYAIDQMTLDKVARSLPALRGAAPMELLPGKLAAVFDVRLRQWRKILHVPDAHSNEKATARGLLEGLEGGALLLFDHGGS